MTSSALTDPDDLHLFYEDLVRTLRDRGVVCGITSGLACVHYGVAETTKDCDLLCHPDFFDALLDLLSGISIAGEACCYRGHISAPLSKPWHLGGWTSHFEWNTSPRVTLDVFGRAVRQSSPWEHDLSGLYAGMNVVAEMKRTDRAKDWPFITSLGSAMLRAGDSRGWLHLFDADVLEEMQQDCTIPGEMIELRPTLQLAARHDPNLRLALRAEQYFWQDLDRLRIRVYRHAVRPFVLVLGREGSSRDLPLRQHHEARLVCAQNTLQPKPLATYGSDRLIDEARNSTAALVKPELLKWLPNVSSHFTD